MEKNKKFKIIINIISIFGTIILCVFLYFCIKEELFTSQDKMKCLLDKCGIFAPIIFIIIQIIQVIIPFIPGGVSQGVGVLVFGAIYGFIYNYIGIVIGSIIVFFLARQYGMPLIRKMFKKEIIDKYLKWLNKGEKFDKFFALAIFLPVAPDDFLCYFAGITNISTKKYILIILLLKPFTISIYSFLLVQIANIMLKYM